MDDTDQPPAQMTLEREVVDGGRTYQITATTLPDGRTAISLRSGPVDALELNEISGVIAKEDLVTIARILRPELAGIAAWHGLPVDSVHSDRREATRRQHPNAFTPWSEEDERRLLELYDKGVSVRQIAKHLGRRPGGVTARLEKLGVQSDLPSESQPVT